MEQLQTPKETGKLQKIFELENPSDTIKELRSHRYTPQPDVAAAEAALNIENHDVNNKAKRKDKKVVVTDEDANGNKVINTGGKKYRTEKVARVALAIQKLIIGRAAAFLFGNAPRYNSTQTNDNEKAVAKALDRILVDAKTIPLNQKIARLVFGYKECAEMWYPVESAHARYGFKSQFKMRVTLFSPALGDTLYPYFDEFGDMIAFSREFSKTDEKGVVHTFFETFTDAWHYLWALTGTGYEMVEGFPKPNPINKIPVIYGYQDHFETEDVDSLISRLETLLSNFADTNDYHASPKIFTTGVIKGWSKKGESGAVIEGEKDATMQYVSWQNAPESVKLEIETLLKMIYTITQTPDISFDAVKGLNVSGIALKLLFMDAHLKVNVKREIFDDYLTRRANILLRYIAQMNTSLAAAAESLIVEPEIIPYIITSEKDDLDYWMAANGGKAVISQEESIEKAGVSKNPKQTMEMISAETAKENTFAISEPTFEE